ncbi:MAG: hypothetical protein CMK71_05530 [Pseudomonadaceae bacterium]|nr:hypothetical protein [Pseudomonadaceae bacterium]
MLFVGVGANYETCMNLTSGLLLQKWLARTSNTLMQTFCAKCALVWSIGFAGRSSRGLFWCGSVFRGL